MNATTDAEQVQMIKKWWKDYGRFLLLAVIAGLLIGYGWRYYQRDQLKKSGQASMVYEQVLVADMQKNDPALVAATGELTQHYASTPYASLAQMLMARSWVEKKQYDKALVALQWVIKKGEPSALQQISRINAARILLTQNKADAALKILNKENASTYRPLVNQVKGDIYQQKGDKKQAKQFYQKAAQALAKMGLPDPFLNMKLSQAGGVVPSVSSKTAVPGG